MKILFHDVLWAFTAAIEAEDARAFAALFGAQGVYHDTLYGAFRGPDSIVKMLEGHWFRDGVRFRWDMFDPVFDGRTGYANWIFSFASKVAGRRGRAVVDGVGQFILRDDGRIDSYREWTDGAGALLRLGAPVDAVVRRHARYDAAVRARSEAARHLAE